MPVNFIDVTLDLGTESHKPYRKPNDRPLYVHVDSNHPPNALKHIPLGLPTYPALKKPSTEQPPTTGMPSERADTSTGLKWPLKVSLTHVETPQIESRRGK